MNKKYQEQFYRFEELYFPSNKKYAILFYWNENSVNLHNRMTITSIYSSERDWNAIQKSNMKIYGKNQDVKGFPYKNIISISSFV